MKGYNPSSQRRTFLLNLQKILLAFFIVNITYNTVLFLTCAMLSAHVMPSAAGSLSVRIYLSSLKEYRTENIFSADLHRNTLQLHLVLPADCCVSANQMESKPLSSRTESRALYPWCMDGSSNIPSFQPLLWTQWPPA